MITEVMALLVAVGAVMIFVVWNQNKSRRQKVEERREVEESTGKLKQELEKTANEVIGKMENQVSNIEDLLDEAEKNRTVLEGRVAELRKLLKRSEGQSTEIRDLLTKLEETSDTIEDLQRKLEAAEKKITMSMQMPVPQIPMQIPMQSTIMPMSTPMMAPMMAPSLMTTPLPNVPSPISPPPILSSRQNAAPTINSSTSTKPSTTVKSTATPTTSPEPKKPDKAEIKKALEKASLEGEKSETKDFAQVLEKSMNEKPKEEVKNVSKVPRVPDRRSIIVASKSNQPATVVETEPVKIETTRPAARVSSASKTASTRDVENKSSGDERLNNSTKIKNMLLEGMSVEEIARKTGLGRGAVELVQEMTRRKLERKS